MTFQEAMKAAYINQLCIDFYSNTITDPEGTEWYWGAGQARQTAQGDDIVNLIELVKEVVEGLEDSD